MRKELADFKRCMRTGYRWSRLTKDDISKSDPEKSMTKLIDDQKTSIMSFKRDVNNMLIIIIVELFSDHIKLFLALQRNFDSSI